MYINLYKDKFGNYSKGFKDSQGNWHNVVLYPKSKDGGQQTTKDGTPYVSIKIDDKAFELAKQEDAKKKQSQDITTSSSVDPDDLPF